MSIRRGRTGLVCSLIFIFSLFPLTAQTSAVTSEGYLRDWQYDGDHVAFSTENGIVRSVMTADEEKLVLRLYDERHRLTSEVVWNGGYDSIFTETSWTYGETSVFPETMTKKLHDQNQIVEVLYSETGLETERSTFQMSDGKEGSLLEKTSLQYDEQKRIVCKIRENNALSEADEGARVEKTEYIYTDKSSAPDMLYFEDDVLIEKTEYVSEESYLERLYFDDMEILSYWTDGVKTEEVYYLDGEEVKRKKM